MDESTLVEVAGFGWMVDAQQAEGLLRSEGIPCLLKNETILRIDPPLWTNGPGGLSLMVAASDLERAREILNTRVSDEDLEAQAAASTPKESAE